MRAERRLKAFVVPLGCRWFGRQSHRRVRASLRDAINSMNEKPGDENRRAKIGPPLRGYSRHLYVRYARSPRLNFFSRRTKVP
jgi:hypothetical protein